MNLIRVNIICPDKGQLCPDMVSGMLKAGVLRVPGKQRATHLCE